MNQLITDPSEWNQLRCVCGSAVFTPLIHITGVLLTCAKCQKRYKLESQSGVKIADA